MGTAFRDRSIERGSATVSGNDAVLKQVVLDVVQRVLRCGYVVQVVRIGATVVQEYPGRSGFSGDKHTTDV